MLKPTSNFKLAKSSKRLIASILSPQQRTSFKKSMIEAQLAEAIQPRVSKSRNQEREPENG